MNIVQVSSFILCFFIFYSSVEASQTDKIFKISDKLFLNKKRKKSVLFLKEKMAEEKFSLSDQRKIKKRINKYGEYFYTDKVQKKYESSISLFYKESDRAISQLKEALIEEPLNIKLIEKFNLGLLKSNSCNNSQLVELQSKVEIYEFHQNLNRILMKVKLCLGLLSSKKFKNPKNRFEKLLLLELLVIEEKYVKAKVLAEMMKREMPDYIELDYWLWKISLKLSENPDIINVHAKAYFNRCLKNLNKIREKYSLQVKICSRIEEINVKDN